MREADVGWIVFGLLVGGLVAVLAVVITGAGQSSRAGVMMRLGSFKIRFGLKTCLIASTLLCVFLGLVVNRAQRQKRTVQALGDLGCHVFYDSQERPYGCTFTFYEDSREVRFIKPGVLVSLLGEDCFRHAIEVFARRPLDDAHVELLSNLSSLKCVHLDDCRITNAGLAHLSGLRHLQVLSLSRTKIDDSGMKHLKYLKELAGLSLQGTAVGDEGVKQLGDLRQLKLLVLSRTLVSDNGLRYLSQMTCLDNVIVLGLSGTRITDESAGVIKKLQKLTYLDLTETLMTAGCIDEIRVSLPLASVYPN